MLFVIHALPAQQNLIVPTALLRMASPAEKAKAAEAPALRWPQHQTELGYQAVGSEHTAELVLQNPGGAPLHISKIKCSCPQISIPDESLTIPAGRNQALTLKLQPQEASSYHCYLTLYTNTEEWIHIIALEGIAYSTSRNRP
ncbi:MAG: DUF1573 domain-containing protein [Bacteroidota bacterium]